MANVILKGKTLVPQGRYRGVDKLGADLRWTGDESVVEVDEAQARIIEGDPMIVSVRLAAWPDEGPKRRSVELTPEQQDRIAAEVRGAHERADAFASELEQMRARLAAAEARAAEKPKGDSKPGK